jgi:uncharacterized Fe-S cluster-containing radical SAM superfamily protein
MTTGARDETLLHPLVEYVQRRLEALLRYVDLECDGQVIEPTGFRLKDMAQWRQGRYAGLYEALGAFSGYCNAQCEFCYERGNPLPYERAMLSVAEAQTRIRLYDVESGWGLLQSRPRLYLEPFTNPHVIELLRLVRQRAPEQFIHLTTNGSFLTPKMLDALAELAPLALIISVNTADRALRRKIMDDPRAGVTLDALPLLRERNLTFVGSVVAWPTLPAADLEATLRYIDGLTPRALRVTLPGYSRFFSAEPLFDTEAVWRGLCDRLEAIRPMLRAPLIVLPNLYAGAAIIPRVGGVILQSPAHRAGLRYGDLITAVDGAPVHTRQQAKSALRQRPSPPQPRRVDVLRDGAPLSVELVDVDDPAVDLYPYKPLGYRSLREYGDGNEGSHYGLVLPQDPQLSSLQGLFTLIAEHRARRVLLLTSEIMGPIIATLLETLPEFARLLAALHLAMVVPRHDYWGGNIIMGDLYMVSDYLQAAREYIAQEGAPDLILLPSSFASDFGRDLLGVSYLEIERRLGIPVELLPCEQISI